MGRYIVATLGSGGDGTVEQRTDDHGQKRGVVRRVDALMPNAPTAIAPLYLGATSRSTGGSSTFANYAERFAQAIDSIN